MELLDSQPGTLHGHDATVGDDCDSEAEFLAAGSLSTLCQVQLRAVGGGSATATSQIGFTSTCDRHHKFLSSSGGAEFIYS